MSYQNDDEMIKKRLLELAARSYDEGRIVFSGFLDLQGLDCFHQIERQLSFAGSRLWGGFAGAERQMLRFGDPVAFGYDEGFPLVCLRIEPASVKFAEPLTHRD